MAQPARSTGGLPLGEVTVPLLNYKVPTVFLIGFALLLLFGLHLVGFSFVGVARASVA